MVRVVADCFALPLTQDSPSAGLPDERARARRDVQLAELRCLSTASVKVVYENTSFILSLSS